MPDVQTMRAVAYSDYGPPDVLEMHQRAVPRTGGGEVLIRVVAAGVNPIDCRLRSGEFRRLLPGGFPRIPGYDVAGYVEHAEARTGFSAGDRVIAYLKGWFGGGYAEYTAAAATATAPLTDDMELVDAAALPLAGCTALQAFRNIAGLRSGDHVLINGAGGGVGSLAVQIAKAYGAHVTGVASGPRLDFLTSLGADETVDYHETDFTKMNRQWNVIFDVAGKSSYRRARGVLAQGGCFVSTEPSAAGICMSVLTAPLSRKGRVVLARPDGSDLRELVRLVSTGRVRIVIDTALPLSEAAEAHRRLEAGGVQGKLVLKVAES